MHGTITDLLTGKPIPGAVFDIWQASANGKYDFQDPENQTPNNLRGKFTADENGKYWFYCYHPTAYSLPTDGPAYQLLTLMDRHPMRPAHIHIMVCFFLPRFLESQSQVCKGRLSKTLIKKKRKNRANADLHDFSCNR
jgi:protocatechuate 3,4-dioxygenase beta subunit